MAGIWIPLAKELSTKSRLCASGSHSGSYCFPFGLLVLSYSMRRRRRHRQKERAWTRRRSFDMDFYPTKTLARREVRDIWYLRNSYEAMDH